jgi:hypothetical protein
VRNTSGLRRGRPKGAKNKATVEVKYWFAQMFASEEWRASAVKRIIEGKAPHLEAHGLQVLMPKTDKAQISGDIAIRWAE